MRRIRRFGGALAVALVAVTMLSGCLAADVRYLASDALHGRDNQSAGSLEAQRFLLTYLKAWTVGANPSGTGDAAYQQAFPGGTNLVGILPGTDLADQYVLVGGHYDGLGSSCRDTGPADAICNGATDNATGTSVVVDVLRWFALNGVHPRRSIVFALWDREEDGLLGSAAYVANPLVPLAKTVAYVNLDVQGSDIRPSGASSTFAIGAETGGPLLRQAVSDAASTQSLDTWQVSLIFGQGRSDHANLVAHGVPSVFFSDSTGPCYHTVGDDADVVDYDKLAQQAATARRLVADLASRDDAPTFVSGTPLATFQDAFTVLLLFDRLTADLDTMTPEQQTMFLEDLATVYEVVVAGPAAFDQDAMIAVLLAASEVVNDILTTGTCQSYIPGS